ncbi:MAG: thioredoxin [Planctomycetes bacterium]|nr:thioredoxin [Planctomycetota bacterium]
MPRPVGDAEAPAKPVKETITVQPRGESESIVTLTDNTFAAQVNGAGKPVLVDFWATWCGPCKTQAPIVADLADAMHEKVAFGKVDVDKNPRTTQLYGIEAIPTLVILKDGKEVARFVGLTPKEKIQTRLAEVLAGK